MGEHMAQSPPSGGASPARPRTSSPPPATATSPPPTSAASSTTSSRPTSASPATRTCAPTPRSRSWPAQAGLRQGRGRHDDGRQLDAADRRRLRGAARHARSGRPSTGCPCWRTFVDARDRRRRLRHRRRGPAHGPGLRRAAPARAPGHDAAGLRPLRDPRGVRRDGAVAPSRPGRTRTSAATGSGLDAPLGAIDRSRLNVNGSSLAAGHPFAATGGRIVASLAKLLHEKGSGRPRPDLDLRRRWAGRRRDPRGGLTWRARPLHRLRQHRRRAAKLAATARAAPAGAAAPVCRGRAARRRSGARRRPRRHRAAGRACATACSRAAGRRRSSTTVPEARAARRRSSSTSPPPRSPADLESLRAPLGPGAEARSARAAGSSSSAATRHGAGIARPGAPPAGPRGHHPLGRPRSCAAGATANLVLVADGAEANADCGAVRFLLSGRSAYVDGQVVRVGAGDPAEPERLGRAAGRQGRRRHRRGPRHRRRDRRRARARRRHRRLRRRPGGRGRRWPGRANEVGGTALQVDVTAADAGQRILDHATTPPRRARHRRAQRRHHPRQAARQHRRATAGPRCSTSTSARSCG